MHATIGGSGQPATTRWRVAAILPFAILLSPHPQIKKAQAQAQTRSEIPIREVVLSGGVRRYGVPIKVGNSTIEAGLDTGSTGLRILPGILASTDAQGSNTRETYSYQSGASLTGEVGTGTLAIGALSAPVTMELINLIGCRSRIRGGCFANGAPRSLFGIMGGRRPGEGFAAILGTNMAEARIQSPLSAIGASPDFSHWR